MNSFLRFLAISLILLSSASPALAQTEADFSEEGLSDADLTVDVEAETLPTTDPVPFWWEQIRANVLSVFTFNAERKVEQYRLRLHILDRKLTACSEIGDEECVSKIEERMVALKERTENYIAQREELKEKFQERFAAWRDRREARIEELKENAVERREKRSELREERRIKQEAAQENRKERAAELRKLRDLNKAQRQELLEKSETEWRDLRQEQQGERQELRKNQQAERKELRQENKEEARDLKAQRPKASPVATQ